MGWSAHPLSLTFFMTLTNEQRDDRTWILLLLIVVMLVGFGTVIVYSASSGLAQLQFDNSNFFLNRWAIRMAISLVVMVLLIHIDYRVWRKKARLMLAVAFAFLLVLLILKLFGIGGVRGAYRWIPLPGGQFQPADMMRVVLVLYLADSLTRRQDVIENFKSGFLPHVVIIGTAMVMILMQPDLGTAMAIGLTCALMLYLGGVRLRHLIATFAGLLPILYVIVFVFGYRRERVMTFIFPGDDAQNTGYQIAQSLLALGSGGFWGTGLGQGQQKYFFLPEPHTDFVFSIVGEELGLWGTLLVLILFLIFGRCGLRIARTAPDTFGFLFASGITITILIYALINMGVATGLLPVTGLPLPFISYGGSSLMFTLSATGVLIGIGRARTRNKTRHSPAASQTSPRHAMYRRHHLITPRR
ncbi:MAG: putative lipid II flippase FtsW [Gemmatimonadota bacterium]|nr:putative lipid II flippase FtsW [Gemmatimonadota bacterium]